MFGFFSRKKSKEQEEAEREEAILSDLSDKIAGNSYGLIGREMARAIDSPGNPLSELDFSSSVKAKCVHGLWDQRSDIKDLSSEDLLSVLDSATRLCCTGILGAMGGGDPNRLLQMGRKLEVLTSQKAKLYNALRALISEGDYEETRDPPESWRRTVETACRKLVRDAWWVAQE